jgi:hypothetical protein
MWMKLAEYGGKTGIISVYLRLIAAIKYVGRKMRA